MAKAKYKRKPYVHQAWLFQSGRPVLSRRLMLRTNPPQSETNIRTEIETRIAEVLHGGPAPTDPEDP